MRAPDAASSDVANLLRARLAPANTRRPFRPYLEAERLAEGTRPHDVRQLDERHEALDLDPDGAHHRTDGTEGRTCGPSHRYATAGATLPVERGFEDPPHDPHVDRLHAGPHGAGDRVLLLHEGREQQ